ncbi:MAG: FAD-dependent oxidoreductase [Anaerolineae bacterium]|nr:FAD-dependent oxidoreductase [Anaerolineae bacterium]
MTTLKHDYDVIVVGGGPSGFIATIAAARTGAKTLLIEKYGFLGGMPTGAALGPISPFHFGDEQVVEGIPQEFVDRMVEAGGSTGHVKCTNPHGSGSYLCFYDRQVYKWIALQMVTEAGADLLMHSFLSDAIVEDGQVRGVVVTNKSGQQSYTAKVVVDATGDGDVAARAGAEYVLGRSGDGALQPITMMFDMGNVNTTQIKSYMDTHKDDFEWTSECVPLRPFSSRLQQEHFVGQGLNSFVKRGFESGELYLGRDSILFLTTVNPGVLHFNSTRVANIDGTKAEDLTRGEIDARKQVMSLSRFLTKHVPGFKDAYLSDTGIQVGIRESRHILGNYVLTGEDVMHGRKFDDVTSRGYFPIDIHNVKGKSGYFDGGGTWGDLDDSYDIPYRCLVPKAMDGLVIAGRTISATHEAHGSFRTQGGVMGIGQAAGTAAGLAALKGVAPRDLDVTELQQTLVEGGASIRRDPEKVAFQYRRAAEAVQKALENGDITGLHMAPQSHEELAVAQRAPRL